MRRFLLAWCLLLAGIACIAQSEHVSAFWQSRDSNYNQKIVSSGGGCSQATTFLARTSGLSGTESTAYTTMICGMVTDGTWSLFDGLYVFATNTKTTAKLNLVSTSYGLTENGTCTFAADAGYTGDGSTCYLATGYTPSTAGGNMTLNSAHVGLCVLTSRTIAASQIEIGSQSTSSTSLDIEPLDGSGDQFNTLNDFGFSSYFPSPNNAQGNWALSRTASSGYTEYLNGSSVAAPGSTSVALPAQPIYILAYNTNGTAASFGTDQIGAAYFGGGLTGTQASNIYSRINAFLTAVGAPSGC